MDETPSAQSQPSRDGASKIAWAIVAAAVLIAGTILFVSRGPDECEEANQDVLALVRELKSVQDAPPGTVPDDQVQDLFARMRQRQASLPEGCEPSDELVEEVRDLDG